MSLAIVSNRSSRFITSTSVENVWHLALKSHTPFPCLPIARTTPLNQDAPFDLAIYQLPGRVVDAVKRFRKDFLPVSDGGLLHEGDDAVAVGFPGKHRRIVKENVSHAQFIVPCAANLASDRQIVLHQPLPSEKRVLRFG